MAEEQNRIIVPHPDPTTLTTQALQREIKALDDMVGMQVQNIKELFESKIAAIHAKIDLHREEVAQVASHYDALTKRLLEVRDEKFHSIDIQIQSMKDAAHLQHSTNMTLTSKSEASFSKTIDQLQTLLVSVRHGTDAKIDDLRARIDRSEGAEKGSANLWTLLISVGGVIISLVTLLVLLLTHIHETTGH